MNFDWKTLSAAVLALGFAAPAAAQDEEEGSSWTDDLSVSIFADAYYLADWNLPAVPSANSSEIPHRAFDVNNGFGFAFAGADFAYEGDNWGAYVDLRFGSAQAALIGAPIAELASVKQAYASWSPTDCLTLDIGQFDTLYGAEVANSWQNLNYTRGALYFLMQPFYHSGLRASWEVSDKLSLTGMLVNGTNLVLADNNQSPHIGLQAGISPTESLFLALGYYAGAANSGFGGGASGPTDDDQWEHFIDVVATLDAGKLSLVFNGDVYISSPDDDALYYGLSLAANYQIVDVFGVALRGEYLGDPDLFISGAYQGLGTVTLTLDYRPVPNVIIRLDNRLEVASRDIFASGADLEPQSTYFSSTLGVVVTSNP